MPTAEDIRELNRRLIEEVFGRRNLDYLDEALADGFVEHEAMPPEISNDKQGAKALFAMMLRMSSDLRADVIQTIVAGDRLATHTVLSGSDTGGAFPGAPPTNRPFTIEGIDILRVDDEGRFTEHWGISDQMGLMIQLGLVPPPSPPA